MLRHPLRGGKRQLRKGRQQSQPQLLCGLAASSESSYGLAFWFECNFILWENTLAKGKSCLGVVTLRPHVK